MLSTDETMDGPFEPIDGVLLVEEHHADGGLEEKAFAPAYGEFYTAADSEVEALAMAAPTDAADGEMPEALSSAVTLAGSAVQTALDEDLSEVERIAGELEAAIADLGESRDPGAPSPTVERCRGVPWRSGCRGRPDRCDCVCHRGRAPGGRPHPPVPDDPRG